MELNTEKAISPQQLTDYLNEQRRLIERSQEAIEILTRAVSVPEVLNKSDNRLETFLEDNREPLSDVIDYISVGRDDQSNQYYSVNLMRVAHAAFSTKIRPIPPM